MIDDGSGRQVTTGTPIGVMIENVDQRSKDYSEIKDKYRPGHADYAYDAKYGIRDYRGGGRSSARETAARVAAGAIARKVTPGVTIRGALVQIGRLKIDRTHWDWDEVGRNPFFSPDAAAVDAFRRLSRRDPQGGLLDRRRHRDRRRGRARRLGRADLRQARSRTAARADEHQRRQGRGDRRRLRRRRTLRRGERRRDAHGQRRAAALSLQSRRRRSRRHFDRTADRRALRGQADLLDPLARAARSPATARRPRSSPRAATTPASASAPCRSARRWWPACWRTLFCAIARKSAGSASPPPRSLRFMMASRICPLRAISSPRGRVAHGRANVPSTGAGRRAKE